MGVRGINLFNGWWLVPPSLFVQNHCAKSGKLGFGGNELRKRKRTSFMGGSFFYWEQRGNRRIGETNLRKGAPFNGWRASRLAGMPHAWPVYLTLSFCYGSEGLHLLAGGIFL